MGMAFADNGMLYFGGVRSSSLYAWNPTLSLSTALTLTTSLQTNNWIKTFGFTNTGEIVFTSNKLQNFWYGYDYNTSETNFRVMKLPIDANAYTMAAPTYQNTNYSQCKVPHSARRAHHHARRRAAHDQRDPRRAPPPG